VLGVLVALPVLVAGWLRGRGDARAVLLALGLAAGFVLLAATVRWQMFGVRLNLANLVLWCPLVALVLARRRELAAVAGTVLVLLSLPMVVENAERPLRHATFADRTLLEAYVPVGGSIEPADYDRAARAIAASGCEHLGLANWIRFEYPLWVALELHGWSGHAGAVDVTNASRTLEDDAAPCALVGASPIEPGGTAVAGGRHLRFGSLEVVVPAGAGG
jgi:hypothetical protein